MFKLNPNATGSWRGGIRAGAALCLLLWMAAGLAGCGRFGRKQHDFVYVSARRVYLRDRVAAVSTRVVEVFNGDKLEALQRGRRFLKVKTAKNQTGWIYERAVIDAKTFDAFSALARQHQQDPVVATGTLRDDIYLHVTPGRQAERFYLLAGNAKVQMLERASAPREPVLGHAEAQPPAKTERHGHGGAETRPEIVAGEPSAGPALEDWWLVRDAQGHTGWLLGSRVDADVPDEIGIYAEGQRIVGSYVLDRVADPASPGTSHDMPEYVAVLEPPKAGLPFDFDQVRVFTWSLRHHRYETAFRLHPIEGYLPMRVSMEPVAGGSAPVFSFQIAGSEARMTDPATGMSRPVQMRTLRFEMDGHMVKRVGPDLAPILLMRSVQKKAAAKEDRAHKRKKR